MQFGEEKLSKIIERISCLTAIQIHKGIERTDNRITITIKRAR